MIPTHYTEGPAKGLTYLDLVLTPSEREALQEVAAIDDAWEPGRQSGGGYFKLPLLGFPDLRKRLCRVMADFSKSSYQEVHAGHDFYLLYFPPNSFVPTHKDPAPKGMRHIRANVGVTTSEPGGGGELIVPNSFYSQSWLPIKLLPGTGVIFEPSAVEHGANRLYKGSQLWVSVGALVKAER